MNGLTFVHPAWFWGLLLLPMLVALRFWAHLRTARRLPGLVSPRLSHRLINGASHTRRWTVFLLQWLALACLVTALARPQFGFEETETEIDARNLLIAIDTSRSMLADDLPPNRLSRAKLAAKDIILSLPEDRIGLIAFAGKPFLQAPFTVDHEAVLESVDQLDTEIIPRGGTNLSAAVDLALETIEEAKIGKSAMILFSDGEALEGLAEVAKVRERAGNLGLSLIAVGVGTTGGSIIPELDENGSPIPGVFVKDEQGQVVRTRLDPAGLQELSRGSGGYVQLGGGAPLAAVVDQIRKQLTTSREESETNRIPIERFLWPLGAAVTLMIFSHLVSLLWLKPLPSRSKLVPATARTALLVLLWPASLHAKDPLADGQEAFERKDYEGALAAYEGSLGGKWSNRAFNRLQLGIGAAAYRMNNYERAAEAYSSVAAAGTPEQRGQALYNLGNTLFRRGELALKPPGTGQTNPAAMQAANPAPEAIEDWETAIEHYEASLALDPDNARTTHNLEHVKKRLEELKQREQEKQDQEKQDQKDQDKQDPKKDQTQEQQKQDQNQNQQDPQEQDSEGQQNPNQQEQEQPQDPNEPKPDSQSGEDPQDPQSGDEPKQQPDSPQPQPGDMPPQPEEPKDGELEADPNQNQPQPANPTPAGNPADMQANPATGYSPSEARQLLDSLADETEVRPLIQVPRGETFKNW